MENIKGEFSYTLISAGDKLMSMLYHVLDAGFLTQLRNVSLLIATIIFVIVA